MKFSHQLHIFTEDHITYFMSFKTKINKSDAIWNNISIYPMLKLVFHIASKNSIQKISFHKLVRSVHTRMSIHYYFGNDMQKLSSEFRNIRLHLNIFFFFRFCPKLFHHYKVLFSYTLLKHLCEVVREEDMVRTNTSHTVWNISWCCEVNRIYTGEFLYFITT